MKPKIERLLKVLTEQGSRLESLLHPGLTEEEILASEIQVGLSFPGELHDYLSVFGSGIRRDPAGERDVDSQLIQDFSVFSHEQCLKFRKMYANNTVLGEDLFPKDKEVTAYPFLSSGGEYISLVWSPRTYAVVWKVNDSGFPSWVWPSMEAFIDYATQGWEAGACKFDFGQDMIEWDARIAQDLLKKCGGRQVGG
ncbi:SMI1/KNR4 family protein [Roseimicrobium sp. ORNL1]|uniref:SMI1/KNR4 family protein n=1 Tax=Roseimicrobium sp. ORNL1 TaxID=2711231 RepID=UPI0013E1C6E5|nr:SMI1/KNR4 family protein [Roseimicrobium sp. ORNL1]QIF01827.1 SMI1/KNR4 family protein [Roseimicrobium sp. ORNL1]